MLLNMSSLIIGLLFLLLLSSDRCTARRLGFLRPKTGNHNVGYVTDSHISANHFLEKGQEAMQGDEAKRIILSSAARSLLVSMARNAGKSSIYDSEEKESVEDIVEMDYAQPHRKPPIHNEKP